MAAVAAPKICREREKRREIRKKKKRKKRRKEERKGEESKRERCIRPMGVLTPLELSKDYKRHKKRGAVKS